MRVFFSININAERSFSKKVLYLFCSRTEVPSAEYSRNQTVVKTFWIRRSIIRYIFKDGFVLFTLRSYTRAHVSSTSCCQRRVPAVRKSQSGRPVPKHTQGDTRGIREHVDRALNDIANWTRLEIVNAFTMCSPTVSNNRVRRVPETLLSNAAYCILLVTCPTRTLRCS